MSHIIKDPSIALRWAVDVLRALEIPFQISGGLAAQAYGSRRELYDIDISIPEDAFPKLFCEVQQFVVSGPSLYKDEEWQLLLMTVNYQGQEIDFGGAYEGRFYDRNKSSWIGISEDLSTAEIRTVFGIQVPVICKQDLIAYKRLLDRDVDREDIAAIE